jgi:periplasmic protein TonB
MIFYYLAALTAMGDGSSTIQNNSENIIGQIPAVSGKNFVPVNQSQTPALSKGEQRAKPIGNPGEWVTTNDYPAQALREERQGTVAFTLQIDARGAVTNCTVTESSGTPALDEETCRLITLRAKFQPAKNKQGRAITGKFSNRVRWQIPTKIAARATYPAPVNVTSTSSFTINADGTVSDCKMAIDNLSKGNETIKTPRSLCDLGAVFEPYKNSAGEYVPVNVVQTYVTKVTELPIKAPAK